MKINNVIDSSNDIISCSIEKEISLLHTLSILDENQISMKIVTNIEKTIYSKEYRNKRDQLITICCMLPLVTYLVLI